MKDTTYFPKTLAIVIAGILGCAASLNTTAQELVQVQPTPLTQEGLVIPGFGNEGFIVTRYTVKADGTTDDVEIIGGLTNPFYEKAIKESVASWTFTPGTSNGTAVDFLNQEYVFRIKLNEQLSSSTDFQEEYEKLNTQYQAQEFEDGKKTIRSMLRQHVHTALDYAVTNQMLSTFEMKLGDPFAALEAITLATQSSVNAEGVTEYILTPDLLQSALRQQLILATSVRQQAVVVRTWEKLEANFDIPADDKLLEFVTTARQQIDSTDPLPLLAKIRDKQWSYEPAHRMFTVADVVGKLNKINVRCEHRNLELEYQPDVDWTLPASAGKCVLDFEGKNDTTFTIYEFKE